MEDKFCLRWNDFESNVSCSFQSLRQRNRFFDVSLVVEDQLSADVKIVQAHRVILAACSPFFDVVLSRSHLNVSNVTNPMIYLKGINARDLGHILDFMYHGEVNVKQDDLNSFLAAAGDLKIKGLTESNSHEPNRKPLKLGHKREATENGKSFQTSAKKRAFVKQSGGGLGTLLNSSKHQMMPSPTSILAEPDDDHMPVRAELGTGEEEDNEDGDNDSKEHFGNNSNLGQRLPSSEEFEDSMEQFDPLENSGDISFGDGSHGIQRTAAEDEMTKGMLNSSEALELRSDLQALFQRLEIKPEDTGNPTGTMRSQCVQCSNLFQPGYKFRRHILGAHADAELMGRIELFMQNFQLSHPDGTYTCMPCGIVMKGSGAKDRLLHFVGKHIL